MLFDVATWRQRPSWIGRRSIPGRTGLLVSIVAACAAGCTATEGPLVYSNSVTKPVNSLGCYIGTFRLHISSTHARPDQTVRLAATGPGTPSAGVITESWGLLGTASNGRFVASYNLAAITPFLRHAHNAPLGTILAGVGLPNRPFRVRVPHVPSGNYVIQFAYTVNPGSMGNPGPGAKTYTLCAALHVD